MVNQPEFPYAYAGREPDPRLLIDLLRGRGWVTCRTIQKEAGITDRAVRNLAHHSKGQIISGQQGYKLTQEATIEEIQRASNWLRSQANEMRSRALQIDRVYHSRVPV